MPVDLSVKKVPLPLARRLKERARKNGRSLQKELLLILEGAIEEPETLTPEQILERVRARDLHTPSDSVAILRSDRRGH